MSDEKKFHVGSPHKPMTVARLREWLDHPSGQRSGPLDDDMELQVWRMGDGTVFVAASTGERYSMTYATLLSDQLDNDLLIEESPA